jgi:hypothetical protein
MLENMYLLASSLMTVTPPFLKRWIEPKSVRYFAIGRPSDESHSASPVRYAVMLLGLRTIAAAPIMSQ